MDLFEPHTIVGQRLHESALLGHVYHLRDANNRVTQLNMTESRKIDGMYVTGYNASYPYPAAFEENFDTYYFIHLVLSTRWMAKYFMLVYLVGIFSLKRWMANRSPFSLRAPLFFWNFSLASLSFFGAIRSLQEMGDILSDYGFTFTCCYAGKAFLDNRVGGFWNWMFTLSKVPELGDTVFIVLRKQPLIFLHWYHHVTVLLYSWYSYSDYIATARWFVLMNYIVHSIMYSYYALKALKFKVSKFVSMFITTAQLAQMVMGAVVNIWAYQVKQAGNECHVSYENIKISLIMYTSYFVLFAHFFRRAYMKKPTQQKPTKNGAVSSANYEYVKGKSTKFE